MQEFLVIPAYSVIANISWMSNRSFTELEWMQSGIPEFVHIRNSNEVQEFLVIAAYSGIPNIYSSHPHPHPQFIEVDLRHKQSFRLIPPYIQSPALYLSFFFFDYLF